MIDWPDDLRGAVKNESFFVAGGREYDGRAIRPIDRAEIAAIAKTLTARGIRQTAVTAVFGTSYPDDEVQIAEWMRAENPQLQVTLSHRIGRFGILERENATLLNAMLRPLAERTVAGFQAAVPAHLFISQNDGTAMRAESAAQLPIFTVASGPTNSLRGAGILAALRRRDRDRCGRHHHRCRRAARRIPAGGGTRTQHRGREDQLPHAGLVLDWRRRRKSHRRRYRRGRPGQRRLSHYR